MKQIKRLTTLALAVMLLLSLAIPAFAADDTITISVVESASGAPVTGHTYKVYQIFTGDVATNGKTLTNAAYGKNYNLSNEDEALNVDVDDAMEALNGMSGAEAAEYLMNNLTNEEEYATLNDGNNHKVENVPAGYYLIVDVTENLPAYETKSAYILQVLESVVIQSKHDKAPKTYKKIDDVNDSTGEGVEIQWHDSADHDIGDLIDFQLNAEIPVSFNAFKTNNTNNPEKRVVYPFTFHDVEEVGLDFSHITSVYVLNGSVKTELTSNDYTLVTSPSDGCTFDVVFADLTAIEAVQSGSVLVVEYKSRLNESAVIGKDGNPNKMRGEFRNYHAPETPEFTPWDTVIAFTFRVNVDKYNGAVANGNKLIGANFTLYKEVPEGTKNPLNETEVAKTGAEIKAALSKNVKASDLEDTKYYIVAGIKTGDATGFNFDFKGIDDGNYVLVETTIPDGFNAWDAVAFTITAEHDEESDTPQLTKLTGGDLVTGEFQGTGIIKTDIENHAGVELPETGGMGTTIFYALGGMMVLVAVVLLVTKKRMASAE